MSHTPGPWKAEYEEEDQRWRVYAPRAGGGDYLIARVSRYAQPDLTGEANAKLIAVAPVMAEALRIVERRDIRAAVAFLIARKIELPHVGWSSKEEERTGQAYEHAGIHEDDARYIDPAREELFCAVARAALSSGPDEDAAEPQKK